IYDLDPDNNEAAQRLGMLAFSHHQYAEAGKLLKQYLQEGDGDYEANFAYGEILKQTGKANQAPIYYKRALTQVLALDDKNPDILADQARLLYLNHQPNDAIMMMQDLLVRDPGNKAL